MSLRSVFLPSRLTVLWIRQLSPGTGWWLTSSTGSSFAIEDATVLANSLLNNPPSALDTDGFSNVLEDYAEIRVPRSKHMAKAAYWLGVVSLGETWYWRWLRDFATAWVPAGEDLKK